MPDLTAQDCADIGFVLCAANTNGREVGLMSGADRERLASPRTKRDGTLSDFSQLAERPARLALHGFAKRTHHMPTSRQFSKLAAVLLTSTALHACSSVDDSACPTGVACKGTAQTPAVGSKADIEAWFASGAYLKWKCETPNVGAGRDDTHGPNRVCSNDALSASEVGEFPVGAANVKELREDDGTIKGYAFMLKVKAGAGTRNWYWYEKIGSRTVANAVADDSCTGCHDGAPRDGVRIRVTK